MGNATVSIRRCDATLWATVELLTYSERFQCWTWNPRLLLSTLTCHSPTQQYTLLKLASITSSRWYLKNSLGFHNLLYLLPDEHGSDVLSRLLCKWQRFHVWCVPWAKPTHRPWHSPNNWISQTVPAQDEFLIDFGTTYTTLCRLEEVPQGWSGIAIGWFDSIKHPTIINITQNWWCSKTIYGGKCPSLLTGAWWLVL